MKIYLAIAAVIVVALVLYQSNVLNFSPAKKFSEEEVVSFTSGFGDGRAFISDNPSYEVEVAELDPATVKNLARDFPVIYEELPEKILYRVEYKSGEKGLLLIVDMEKMQVLKSFSTIGIGFGG